MLDAHGVEFIVVGGMAAVIGGAPVVTQDVDVLRSVRPDQVDATLAALAALDATFRTDERRLRPNASHLAGHGHLLLRTRFGVLDLLGSVEQSTRYEDLLADTYVVDLGGFRVRVVALARLLEIKRKLARPKDQLQAMQIAAVLDELRRR